MMTHTMSGGEQSTMRSLVDIHGNDEQVVECVVSTRCTVKEAKIKT